MKILILAAGNSTRMQPVKDKILLDFYGKTLLEHQFLALNRAGFDDFIIVGGAHNLREIEAIIDPYRDKNNIDLVLQTSPTGMHGAVLAAAELLNEDPLLIFNSNDFVDEGIFELVKKAHSHGNADAWIVGKEVDAYFPGGYLKVDEQGRISHIIEKPGAGNEPSNLVNIVVHLFASGKTFLEFLQSAKSDKDDLYEVAISDMIAQGKTLQSINYSGFWQAIKYPWHIQEIFRLISQKTESHISESASVSEHSIISGNVVIDDGAKIFEGAIIKGPAYIGKNCVVANNALVRDSHIGANSVVGFGTEIARSYIGQGVWTHSNYIGDSVIGDNVSFGGGTVTGNLRLDEKNIAVTIKDEKIDSGSGKLGLITGDNIRIAINVSTMPGIKIGSDSIIGAGLVLDRDIPENSFVKGETTLKIVENRSSIGSRNNQINNLKT